MRDVTKKVLAEFVAAPSVLLPLLAGLTAILGSWVFGSVIAGVCGVTLALTSVGAFFTKLTFGLENVFQQIDEKERLGKEKILDDLDHSLRKDRDPRPEECLRSLREMRELIRKQQTPIGFQTSEIFEKFFEICVKQIRQTDELWKKAKEQSSDQKRKLIEQRERIVIDIEKTTQYLQDLVSKMAGDEHELTADSAELAERREEFAQTLLAAERAKERMANLTGKNYDLKEFE